MKQILLNAILLSGLVLTATPGAAGPRPHIGPLLVIGASFENGMTPCVVGKINIFGCSSVNFGDYLSLAQALGQSRSINGTILVEAIAGATTFDRPGFFGSGLQAEVGWEEYGFEKQLERPTLAVANPFTGALTARYVVIGTPNDCVHSAAFVTAPSASSPCTTDELDEVVDRMLAAGHAAVALGLTPVYTGYPPVKKDDSPFGVDLDLLQASFGFAFVISPEDLEWLHARLSARARAELPEAILTNAWRDRFEPLGDGLHPTRRSSQRAAHRVLVKIRRREAHTR